MMEWSHYSQKLFDTFNDDKQNIIVQACPGSGKTTNIKHLWSLDSRSSVYLVFNKHNQVEAESKMAAKPGSQVLTLNGLGHRAVVANCGRVKLDDNKVMNIIKKHVHYSSKKGEYAKFIMLNRVVKMAKSHLLTESVQSEAYQDMLDMYDLESYPGMEHDVAHVLAISDETLTTIDFADQLRLPVIHKMSMPSYHTVLGDEVQDFNPLQAMLVSMIRAERYVFVGDEHQSIYGFRGAMSESMSYLKDTFDCVQLPLSISYRCPQMVVGETQQIFDDIECWDQAQPGSVMSSLDVSKMQYDKETLVLCRLNRPLITLAFKLLQEGIACHVLGRDIGDGLIRLIKKQEVATVRQLIASLQVWYELEMQKARARQNDHLMQSIQDKHDSLQVFISKCSLDDNVQVVIDNINVLFEQGKGCCLSTVHKAKGLEYRRCILLEYGLFDLFAKKQRQEWQAVQERNIKYVAVTRSKEQLIYA